MAANNFSYPYGRTGFRFSLEDASTCTESKLKTLDGNKPVVDVTLAALYIDQVTSRNLVYKSGDACDEARSCPADRRRARPGSQTCRDRKRSPA